MASLQDDIDIQMEVEPNQSKRELLDCSQPFLENLSTVFMNSNFSDVTLKVGTKRYPAHKCLLAASSSYFERMFFGSDWKEKTRSEVELEESFECEAVFSTFLQYFYKGFVSIGRETVVPLVTLADKYDVKVLKDRCSQYMSDLLKNADIEGALSWISFAQQMALEHLEVRCYEVICFNFERASAMKGWKSLSCDQMIDILQRSDVVASSEYMIFNGILSWLNANNMAQKRLSEILPHIRFKNMTAEELQQIEKTSLGRSVTNAGRNLFKDCVLEAFRYVAITTAGNAASEAAPPKRNYTSNFQQVYYSAESTFSITPIFLRENTIFKHNIYTWKIEKSESDKYQLKSKLVRRNAHLYAIKVHVHLQIFFRDSNGIIHYAFDKAVETMFDMRSSVPTIIDIPLEDTDLSGFQPHDVLYRFELAVV